MLVPTQAPQPLRWQLWKGLVLVSVLPLALGCIFYWIVADSRLRHEAGTRLAETAESIGRVTTDHLSKHHQAIRTLAWITSQPPNPTRETPAPLADTLAAFHTFFPEFRTLLVTDASGRVLATSPPHPGTPGEPGLGLGSVSDRSYFRIPMESGRPYISGVFRGRGLGDDAIVAVSAPILDAAGHPTGVVEGSLNLEAFRRFNEHYAGLNSASLVILDPHHHIVFSSDTSRFPTLGDTNSSPWLAAALRSRPNRIHPYSPPPADTTFNNSMLAGHSRFSVGSTDGPWEVLVQQPLATLRRGLLREMNMLGILFLLLVGLALTVSGRVATLVTRPIASVAARLQDMATEEIPQWPPEDAATRITEVAKLRDGFLTLAGRVHHAIDQLRRSVTEANRLNHELALARDSLEKRVEERTLEVSQKNQLLLRQVQEIRELLSLADSTLESTADGILVLSTNHRIVRFNRVFARLWLLDAPLLAALDRHDYQPALHHALSLVTNPDAFLRSTRHLLDNPNATSLDTLTLRDGRVLERYSQPQSIDGTVVGRVWSFRDMTAHRQSLDALAAESEFRRALLERAAEGICVCRQIPEFPHVRFSVWNAQMTRITGYSLEDINRLGWYQTLFPDPTLRDRAIERMDRMLTGQDLLAEEWEIVRADSQKRILSVSTSTVETGNAPPHVLTLIQDVTERHEAAEHTRRMLEEKSILLHEVHHRVKNNLQIVSGLLRLQADQIGDPRFRDALEMSQTRIRSMALVHEKLHQSGDLAHLDFRSYLEGLVHQAAHAHSLSLLPGGIRCSLDIADSTLDLNTAIHCGLLVNELLSNAFKHAFPNPQPPDSAEIRVRWADLGHSWELDVADSGPGLPHDHDPSRCRSLGLRLVHLLTSQLKGSLLLHPGPGCHYTFRFPKS